MRVSSTDQMWRQCTKAEFDATLPDAWPYFVRVPSGEDYFNPTMKICTFPRCHYVDPDQQIVIEHYMRQHIKTSAAVMVDARDVQGKLEGGVVTEDDRRAAIMAQIPDERFQCPFCHTVFPHARVCRFFLDDGKLSEMALCKKAAGGCGKRMQCDSMIELIILEPKE